MEPRVLQHEDAGEGEPIVLVPGGLTGWLSWIPHAERISATRRVIRVQPIHNELGSKGELPDPGYDDVVERESLRMTLDALGIDSADFAAWSGGARAMIEFALTYPQRIRTLTLIEPPAFYALTGVPGGLEDKERADAFMQRIGGRAVSDDDLAEFLSLAGFVGEGEDPRALPGWDRWATHKGALSWQYLLGRSEPIREDFSTFDAPVLLVKGTASTSSERSVVDQLGDWFPSGRVLELEGDHACHISSIDRFMEELEAHLKA